MQFGHPKRQWPRGRLELFPADPPTEEEEHEGEDYRPSEAVLQCLGERGLWFWHRCIPDFCEFHLRRRTLARSKLFPDALTLAPFNEAFVFGI